MDNLTSYNNMIAVAAMSLANQEQLRQQILQQLLLHSQQQTQQQSQQLPQQPNQQQQNQDLDQSQQQSQFQEQHHQQNEQHQPAYPFEYGSQQNQDLDQSQQQTQLPDQSRQQNERNQPAYPFEYISQQTQDHDQSQQQSQLPDQQQQQNERNQPAYTSEYGSQQLQTNPMLNNLGYIGAFRNVLRTQEDWNRFIMQQKLIQAQQLMLIEQHLRQQQAQQPPMGSARPTGPRPIRLVRYRTLYPSHMPYPYYPYPPQPAQSGLERSPMAGPTQAQHRAPIINCNINNQQQTPQTGDIGTIRNRRPLNVDRINRVQPRDRTAPHANRDRDSPGDERNRNGHSYIGLIGMAILSKRDKKMILNDIYGYIMEHYPAYQNKSNGWKNSIRHNLSLNDCFQKADRAPDGKGHFWTIHPANMEDFMSGDFRRKRAQRRVRESLQIAPTQEDLADEERERDQVLPPLPEHFEVSRRMHQRIAKEEAQRNLVGNGIQPSMGLCQNHPDS